MVLTAALPLIFVSMIYSSTAFHSGRSPNPALRCPNAGPLSSTTEETSIDLTTEESSLDPGIASQFTIKVCTSTSCTRKLKERGLDQYHVLGELYAQAQSANMEKCVIVEDGGCQGGRNCKMGPCVAIQHEEFMGNVGLEGMNSNEFQESVFHDVVTGEDAGRVWSCMENAISLMTEEARIENEGVEDGMV